MRERSVVLHNAYSKEKIIFKSRIDCAKWLYDRNITPSIKAGISAIEKCVGKKKIIYNEYWIRYLSNEK